MLNLRTLILGQPRTCPQTGLQNEPRYSEKPSEFGTVNWTPYIIGSINRTNTFGGSCATGMTAVSYYARCGHGYEKSMVVPFRVEALWCFRLLAWQ